MFLSGVRDGLTLFEIYEKYQVDIQNCLQKYVAAGILKDFTIWRWTPSCDGVTSKVRGDK